MRLVVNKPATVYIRFLIDMPVLFQLYDAGGNLYFFRYLDGKTPRIKFNVVDPGDYTSPTPFEAYKSTSLVTPFLLPALPKADRDRWKPVTVRYNSALTDTPAAIYTDTGLIETGPNFYTYPAPIRLFLLLHEVGHLFYSDEDNCDLYALVNYLRMGYNRSMAYYALANILRRTPANIERLKSIFNSIQKTQLKPLL